MHELQISDVNKELIKQKIINKESEFYREKRKRMTPSDFECIKIIGKGAFGEVRLCRDKDKNLVAIKKMKKSEMIIKNQLGHIRAERDILVKAKNDWIVDLKYSFTNKNNLYLVMEYLPGGDLMNLLILRDIFTEEDSKFYIAELILAVESVHNINYIHRDLKPDNILIDTDGHIKLSDFGLCKYYEKNNKEFSIFEKQMSSAKKIEKDKLTHLKKQEMYKKKAKRVYSLVGTPDYIAPEVFSKSGYTETVDWWSIGAILFEMVCGYPPFYSENPGDTCKKVLNWKKYFSIPKEANLSSECSDLIKKLMTDPLKRLGKNGVNEIKSHPFFKNIDWSNVKKMKPSFIPDLKDKLDTHYFEEFKEDEDWEGDEDTELTERQPKEFRFIGYTYKKDLNEKRAEILKEIYNELNQYKGPRQKSENKIINNDRNLSKGSNSLDIKHKPDITNISQNSPKDRERYDEFLREKNRGAFKKITKKKDIKKKPTKKNNLVNIDNHRFINSPNLKKNIKLQKDSSNFKKSINKKDVPPNKIKKINLISKAEDNSKEVKERKLKPKENNISNIQNRLNHQFIFSNQHNKNLFK